MRTLFGLILLAAVGVASHAAAQPGVISGVDEATVERGVLEAELNSAVLSGGPEGGLSATEIELEYGFTDRLAVALLTEVGRESGGPLRNQAWAVEATWHAATLPGDIEFGVLGEYLVERDGTSVAEGKLLFERTSGPMDARLNLVVERELSRARETAFGYAASVDWEVAPQLRLGVQAFGALGDQDGFGGRREHFLGPVAQYAFTGPPGGNEIEVSGGYLFPLGEARQVSDGQLRFSAALIREF